MQNTKRHIAQRDDDAGTQKYTPHFTVAAVYIYFDNYITRKSTRKKNTRAPWSQVDFAKKAKAAESEKKICVDTTTEIYMLCKIQKHRL